MKKTITPELTAEQLVQDFGLTIPIDFKNLIDLLSSTSLRIQYYEQKLDAENICGMSIVENNIAAIIVNSNISSIERRLFTAAHELGHLILHIQTGKKLEATCSNVDILDSSQNIMEMEANQFAASLLMPRRIIEQKIRYNDLTWDLIRNISQYFATSIEATARRAITLSKDMCALIIHEKNIMLPPIKSNHFPCYIQNSAFPKYLQTINHEENTFPNKLEECNLSDWGLDSFNQQYTCYYASLNSEKYCRRMTLLSLELKEEQNWEAPTFR